MKNLILVIFLAITLQANSTEIDSVLEDELFLTDSTSIYLNMTKVCRDTQGKWEKQPQSFNEYDYRRYADCIRLGGYGKKELEKSLKFYSQIPEISTTHSFKYLRSLARLILGDERQLAVLKMQAKEVPFSIAGQISKVFEYGVGTAPDTYVSLELWRLFSKRGNSVAGCYINRLVKKYDLQESETDKIEYLKSSEFLKEKGLTCLKVFKEQ